MTVFVSIAFIDMIRKKINWLAKSIIKNTIDLKIVIIKVIYDF